MYSKNPFNISEEIVVLFDVMSGKDVELKELLDAYDSAKKKFYIQTAISITFGVASYLIGKKFRNK